MHQERDITDDSNGDETIEGDASKVGDSSKKEESQEMGLTSSTQSHSQQSVPSSTDDDNNLMDMPENKKDSAPHDLSKEDKEKLLSVVAQNVVDQENVKRRTEEEWKASEEKLDEAQMEMEESEEKEDAEWI